MIFPHTLTDIVIKTVAENSDLNTKDLYMHVTKNHPTTLVNIYKIVKKLTEEQILVKNKNKINFHKNRLIEVEILHQDLQKNYNKDIEEIPIKEGGYKDYNAQNFIAIESKRSDIYSHLVKTHNKGKKVYSYNSHLYYLLGFPYAEINVRQKIKSPDIKTINLVGNNTYLDQYCTKILEMQGGTTIISTNIDLPKTGYVVDVIGDHVIEFFLPQRIAHRMDMIFQNTSSFDMLDINLYQSFFNIKDNYLLRIFHNKNKAEGIRNMFQKIEKNLEI